MEVSSASDAGEETPSAEVSSAVADKVYEPAALPPAAAPDPTAVAPVVAPDNADVAPAAPIPAAVPPVAPARELPKAVDPIPVVAPFANALPTAELPKLAPVEPIVPTLEANASKGLAATPLK